MNNYIIQTTGDYDDSLRNILMNLHSLSPSIAKNFYNNLLQKIELLKIFPQMYQISNDNTEYRKIKVKKYIILYRIEKNIIYIIDIFPEKSKLFNNQN